MAAAAFKGVLIVESLRTRVRKNIPITFSDVDTEFGVFPSGETATVLNGGNDVAIVDLVLSAAGTDTSQMEYFINGVSTGQKTLNATMLSTAIGRAFQQAPLVVPAGSIFRITQQT